MKKLTITLGLLFIANLGISQENTDLLTSIKPADEQPAIFNSQAHMDAKKSDKIDTIKGLILANQEDPEKVKALREELWRFENAVIVEKSKN